MTNATKIKEALQKHEALMSKFDATHLRNYGELKAVQDSQNEILSALAEWVIDQTV